MCFKSPFNVQRFCTYGKICVEKKSDMQHNSNKTAPCGITFHIFFNSAPVWCSSFVLPAVSFMLLLFLLMMICDS